jgi:hypothetical protein
MCSGLIATAAVSDALALFCLLHPDNKKAEGSGQPPSELFRSGELAFGSFGDEDAGEVRKQKQQSCRTA